MEIFTEISIILIITTGIASIMRLLRQPLIIGYLLSGVIVGPYVLNLLQANNEIELFSKVGITVLLFIVGLSLNPDTIKETGKSSLVTGLGQIIITSGVGFFIIKALGFSSTIALYGAIALTFSSTIIVMKLLSDRGDLNSLYGKVAIGFLLVQDIVASLLLVIVPLIGAQQATGSTSIGLEFLRLFGIGVAMSAGLYLFAKYVLPKFSDYLAKSNELLFIFSVSWGLVLATLFYKVGFSIEIGALIAGVTLSASKYSFEISSRMRPLRDFFIVMFFVLLGSHLVLSDISALIVPALVLSVYVLIGNPLIAFFLMNRLGYTNRTSFMAGLTVAQISEFSLILMALGLSLGHIDQGAVTLITMVGIITITGSTYFVMYADRIFAMMAPLINKVASHDHEPHHISSDQGSHDMIIFGFGRVGLEFVEKAKQKNMSYVAVDYNPEVFKGSRAQDVRFKFGDVADVEFLEEVDTGSARLIVSTIPDMATNLFLVHHYRKVQSDGIILLTCRTIEEAERLYEAGATYVILSHYLGAYHATQMIDVYELDPEVFLRARDIQKQQAAKHRG